MARGRHEIGAKTEGARTQCGALQVGELPAHEVHDLHEVGRALRLVRWGGAATQRVSHTCVEKVGRSEVG